MSRSDWLYELAAGVIVAVVLTVGILTAWLLESKSPTDRANEARSAIEGRQDHKPRAKEEAGHSDYAVRQTCANAVGEQALEQCIAAERRERRREQREQDDLKAQDRMADGAERLVAITLVQTIISLIGTGLVFFALRWTIKGTKSAVEQAAAAVAANKLLQDIHAAEMRAWMTLDVMPKSLVYDVNGVSLTFDCRVQNIGNGIARHVDIAPQLYTLEVMSNPAQAQQGVIDAAKRDGPRPWGFLVFPKRWVQQRHTVTLGQDELARATQKMKFLYVHLMVTVSYVAQSGATLSVTSSIYLVQRPDIARPEATDKNRAPSAIFVDDGDLTADQLVLWQDILVPTYVD